MTEAKPRHHLPAEIINADPLVALINAHLHVESGLLALISICLKKPKEIDLDRLSFPSKVELAVALGVCPVEMKGALLTINRLRNRLAHRLDAAITKEDVIQLQGEAVLVADVISDPDWDKRKPSARVAAIAAVLQAFLAGVFEAKQHLDGKQPDKSWMHARAEQLYPLPPEQGK